MRGTALQWSPGVKLWSGIQVHERPERCIAHRTEGRLGKTSEARSQDQGHRGRLQPVGIYRLLDIL
jgi:hypothetical protein